MFPLVFLQVVHVATGLGYVSTCISSSCAHDCISTPYIYAAQNHYVYTI